jgi:hypothetical protein
MISIQDINSTIISGSFTNDQLNSISMAIVFARNQIAQKNKFILRTGSIVKFTSSRSGQDITGTVEKISRKYVTIREAGKSYGGLWRVPANMLTEVNE